jgi:hypothetical protein
MGARQKLNALYLGGGLIAAAVVGVTTRSWVAFAVAWAVLIGLGLSDGEIRTRRRCR